MPRQLPEDQAEFSNDSCALACTVNGGADSCKTAAALNAKPDSAYCNAIGFCIVPADACLAVRVKLFRRIYRPHATSGLPAAH